MLATNSGKLTFTPRDEDQSGCSAVLPNVTLTVISTAELAADAVVNSPTSITFPNVRVGTPEGQTVGITNAAIAGSAALDASLSLNGDRDRQRHNHAACTRGDR